jgi:hypothetical protein
MAGGVEYAGGHGCGAAFALGAGDMDGFPAALGIARSSQQQFYPSQIEIGGVIPGSRGCFVIGEAFQVGGGLCVIKHGLNYSIVVLWRQRDRKMMFRVLQIWA